MVRLEAAFCWGTSVMSAFTGNKDGNLSIPNIVAAPLQDRASYAFPQPESVQDVLNFNHLPVTTLNKMIEGASILEQDSYGPKVYALTDGNMLKLFRRKRLLSSALLRPQSLRFCVNAEALKKRGIPTLTPLQLYRLDDTSRTAVLYRPLPGETLSTLLREGKADWLDLLPPLARFINHLHESGVYFRSLHLGNIVKTPDGAFGLIDIADLQTRRRALGRGRIRRNREHFDKYLRKENIVLDTARLWAYCEKIRRGA